MGDGLQPSKIISLILSPVNDQVRQLNGEIPVKKNLTNCKQNLAVTH